MKIVQYPHPTLRYKSKPVKRVNQQLREMVRQMFELMYEANGVGLAANQVDLPFRLFIVNLAVTPDEGEELVCINPILSHPKGNEEREEGCLSLPGLYAPVRRPERVTLNAFSLDGVEIEAEFDGMMARVVQHETDHLDGVLFIDRLSTTNEMAIETDIEEFQYASESAGIPSDAEITKRLQGIEGEFC